MPHRRREAPRCGHRLSGLSTCASLATRPLASIGVAGMLIAAGATVLDVLMRWLFNAPFAALNEVVAMLFAVAISATLPAGLANKVNLRIDLLSRFMTPRLGMWLDAVGGLFLFAFFAILSWQIDIYARQLAAQGRATVMLGLPVAPFIYGVAALFAVGCFVQLVVALNQFSRAAAQPGPQPGEPTHRIFTSDHPGGRRRRCHARTLCCLQPAASLGLGAEPCRARGAARFPVPVAVHARAGAAGRRDGAWRAWSVRRC